MEIVADGLEIFRTKREGQGGGVPAFENPLEIWIFRGIKLGKSMLSTLEDAGRDVAFDVVEKCWIAAELAHHLAGKEDFEQGAPAESVPAIAVKAAALGEGSAGQQSVDHFLRVNERHDSMPEYFKI